MHCTLRRAETLTAGVCADYALRALLLEAWFGPKPGLVDRFSSNSHHDMDYELFRRSSFALRPWFEKVFTEAEKNADLDLSQLFSSCLRPLGIEAEAEMLRITGGVNTHRGALFSIGLLGSAFAVLRTRGEPVTIKAVRQSAAFMVQGISLELDKVKASAGEGARGEAEAGFPSLDAALRRLGESDINALTDLALELEQGSCSDRKAGFIDYELSRVLVSVSAIMEDSNIIRRSGRDVLNTYRHFCRRVDRGADRIEQLWSEEYHRLCLFTLEKGISPGGAADMVSAALFLTFLEKNE